MILYRAKCLEYFVFHWEVCLYVVSCSKHALYSSLVFILNQNNKFVVMTTCVNSSTHLVK